MKDPHTFDTKRIDDHTFVVRMSWSSGVPRIVSICPTQDRADACLKMLLETEAARQSCVCPHAGCCE